MSSPALHTHLPMVAETAVPLEQRWDQETFPVNGPPGTNIGGNWYREGSKDHGSLFGCCMMEALAGCFGREEDAIDEEERSLYCDPKGVFYTAQGNKTLVRGSLQHIPPLPVWQSFTPMQPPDIKDKRMTHFARENSILATNMDDDLDNDFTDIPPGTQPGGKWYKQTIEGEPRYVYREDPHAARFFDTSGYRITPYEGTFDPPIGELFR